MPLELIWANNHTELIAELQAISNTSQTPMVVICRNAAIQTMIGHLFAAYSTNCAIMSLQGWLEKLWMTHGDGRTLISTPLRRRMVAQVVAELSPTLSYALQSAGGRRALERLCETYQEAGSTIPDGKKESSHQALAVAQRYLQLLRQERYVDLGEAVFYLRQQLTRISDTLVFYDVSDLTAHQRVLMRKICDIAQVWWLIDGGDHEVVRSYVRNTVHQLVSPESIHEIVAHDLQTQGAGVQGTDVSQSALTRLASNLYEAPVSPRPTDQSLQIRLVVGDDAQHLATLQAVKSLIAASDVQRIAIVAPDLDKHVASLSTLLEEHDISYQCDLEVPCVSTAFGSVVEALLTLSCGDMNACGFMVYSASAFSGSSSAHVIAYDTYLRQLSMLTQRTGASGIAHYCRWLEEREGKDIALQYYLGCQKGASPLRWKLFFDELLANGIRHGFGTYYQQMTAISAHRTVLDIIDNLAQTHRPPNDRVCDISGESLPDISIKPADILTLLSEAVLQLNPPLGAREVVLTTPARATGLLFDAVVCTGLDATAYQADLNRTSTEILLNSLGFGDHAHQTDEIFERQVLQKQKCRDIALVKTAIQRLIIIYQDRNDEGNDQPPSTLLEEIVAQFVFAENSFEESLHSMTVQAPLMWNAPEVQNMIRNRFSVPEISLHCALSSHGNIPVGTTDTHEPLSPTQLESYVKCPFYWFLDRKVGKIEFDQTGEARLIGTLVHFLLEQAIGQWVAQGKGAIDADNVDDLYTLIETSIARYLALDTQALEEHAQGSTITLLQTLYAYNQGMFTQLLRYVRTIVETEAGLNQRFGFKLRPLLVEQEIAPEHHVTIGDVVIRGKIDRIDVSDTHFVVTDYKSTVTSGNNEAVLRKQNIQVGIYAIAATQMAQTGVLSSLPRCIEPAAALYRSYKTGDRAALVDVSVFPQFGPGQDLTAEKKHAVFVTLLQEISDLVIGAADGIRTGTITPVSDAQNAPCTWCAYLRCAHRRERV